MTGWRVGLVAAVLCVWLLAAPLSAGTDLHGDPLPTGAIARFGTVRLRSPCDFLVFSKDGKTLLGVDGGTIIRVWDAASGKLLTSRRLARRPARSAWSLQAARSPDGRTLLLVEDGTLEMWDIPSGKRLEVPLPRIRKRMRGFTLSDDRRLLLLGELAEVKSLPAGGGFGNFVERWTLLLWDTKPGKERFRVEEEYPLALSPDGKRLASFSGKGVGPLSGPGRIGVRDTATGKLLWQGPKFNAEKVAFTPDSRSLIVAPGGGQSAWHVWDAATGKPSKQLRPPTVGYAWAFALAPDGGSLVIPTSTDYILWDLKTGRGRHAWPGANQAGRVVFAPDGRSVVTWGTVLRRWDSTGKPLYPDVSGLGHIAPVRRLFFTPDGKRLVSVGEDDTLRVWDRASAKPVTSFALAGKPAAWTMTPDGSALVGLDERLRVYRWPLKGGRPPPSYQLRLLAELDRRAQSMDARVLPDGKLAVAFWPQLAEYSLRKYSFSFWDLETGRMRDWGGDPGREYRGDRAALSPGGRLAAVSGEVFDTRTGACRYRLKTPGRGEVGGPHVFSPDGRLLAGTGTAMPKSVSIWEAATGREVAAVPGGTTYPGAVFAPHGRCFASIDGERLMVWDLATGKAILERQAPAGLPRPHLWSSGAIAFSPDGRAVATGHTDGTILLWTVPSFAPAADKWTESMASGLWKDLGHDDSARAYTAVWRLREHPAEALRSLADRFRPVEMPSDAECRTLIRRLDSRRFQERESASRRLEALGRAAEAVLRQALQDRPTAEQKRRIEALLARLRPTALPQGQALRAVRAVAALEAINSTGARRLLNEWAKRPVEPRLAEEARRALERLKSRPTTSLE